uniref:Reverse transcriptase domain-containing protein n=1 Tax=Tanacetum cinerariifolium TaxID=118510 RepID=A0A699JSR4_TANCI|nr:hypothetical protein [Tanacetum cinerariifolium]
MNSCELCGNNDYYGYDFPPQVLFVNNQDSCFNQDIDNNFTQTSPSFPQQYLCCEDCGGPHATFQCQPMNQNFYNSNSFSFDQIQPPQYPVIHHPPQEIKDIHKLLRKRLEDLQIINEELAEYTNSPSWNRSAFYDDDDDEYSIQVSDFLKKFPIPIASVLPTEDLENSLSMGDEHPDTIPEMESDEIIKSSVEDLVPIPSESEGILDNMCDVPFSNKNHFDAESDLIESLLTQDTSIVYFPKIGSLLEEFADELVYIDPIPLGIKETDSDPKNGIRFSEQLLYDDTSSEDDSFENIDYVEASPPDSELVSLEEVKDEILRAIFLNIHLLIVKIESLNDSPTPNYVLKSPSLSFLSYIDNFSPEFKNFSDHTEETSSGSTTTHANNSLPEYDSFHFEIEPDQGELSSVAMEGILGELSVYVHNILLTHPTLMLDLDFILSNDSIGSDLEISFPFGTRNKIFDLGMFFEV